jgi:TDG/mug DNA glycosylase family protein
LQEFKAARPDLEARVRFYRPQVIAFLGKRAIAGMLDVANVGWGRQPLPFAGAQAWVLPNPSGLNRGYTLDALVSAYGELHRTLSSDRQSLKG